ncbi:MAG: UDP-N-acetylglucosamine--LPS N-acetylglucosamine transferase [Planctomycetes bacterium]|nr:UDP-N-acetylglucosamine--LPS N-acetylglucosamine transferase [Planctomycetota bacterium]
MTNPERNRTRPEQRILAVASKGGHWVQLRRLAPAFSGHRVIYATTDRSNRTEVRDEPFYAVEDASRWNKLKLLKQAFQILWIVLRTRPHVVISTGAAPGYFAIRLGKLLGARAIWVDSIANGEELSLSGRRAGAHVDLWLTQWPHLARPEGPRYCGAVLEPPAQKTQTGKNTKSANPLHLSAQTSEQ